MKKSIAENKSRKIIEKSIISLGLKKNLKTDPKKIREILKEMNLDDFNTNFPPMKIFLKEITTKPKNLKPMFDDIIRGIVKKQPAVVEFAELALKKKWFKKSEHIHNAVHVTFILEAMTAAMCNSHTFFIEAQDHLKSKERLCGLDSRKICSSFKRVLNITHNLFEAIKVVSVDPFMIYFSIRRGLNKSQLDKKELKELYKKGELNYLEYKLLLPTSKKGINHLLELVRINIYEAGMTEYKKGFKVNSICAYELNEDIKINPPDVEFQKRGVFPDSSKNKFYKSIQTKENLYINFPFSQKWVSLYTTWNMAFILSDLNDLDIIFPMLFIPSIIDAKKENAGGVRIISLWLTTNNVLFRRYNNSKEIIGPKNKKEMSKAWGNINKKYAVDLAKRETHEDSKELMRHFSKFYAHPFYSLFKLLKIFLN